MKEGDASDDVKEFCEQIVSNFLKEHFIKKLHTTDQLLLRNP